MLYKPDWEKTQKKFIEYWNKENHDRPLRIGKPSKNLNLTRKTSDGKKSGK